MSIDGSTPTWDAVKKHATAEIEKARDALELPGPIEMAQLHRGRIQAFRSILAIGVEKPLIEATSSPAIY